MITLDTTSPKVALTAPTSGATVSRVVTITASASDDVGIAGVQFLLDGASLGAEAPDLDPAIRIAGPPQRWRTGRILCRRGLAMAQAIRRWQRTYL